MPAISVIVPVYNVYAYLHRCVDSILTQTFTDFELILVDDGSPDNCGDICDEYANEDDRVHVIHQKNGGLSAARNAGIDWAFTHSDSQWLTFIDSDDWILPQYLDVLYQAATGNQTDISVCELFRTYGEAAEISIDNTSGLECLTPEELWSKKISTATVACAKLYRKECFRGIRYPVGKLHEDAFTTYKLLFSSPTVAHIDQPLYQCYYNPESITKASWRPKRLEELDALEEELAFFRRRGFQKAYRATVYQYRQVLNLQISDIDRAGRSDADQYKTVIRKHYRKLLSENNILLPYSEYKDSYEFCYSNPMNLFWKLKDFLRKSLSKFKRQLIRR